MKRTPPPQFLRADELVQRIMGIIILLTLVIYPIAMLLTIPFGAWQVISGIIGSLYGSKWRMKYLVGVVLYFSTWPLGFYMEEYLRNDTIWGIMMIFYFLVPLFLGIYYYVHTRKEAPKKDGVKPSWNDMDDVLDADFVSS